MNISDTGRGDYASIHGRVLLSIIEIVLSDNFYAHQLYDEHCNVKNVTFSYGIAPFLGI